MSRASRAERPDTGSDDVSMWQRVKVRLGLEDEWDGYEDDEYDDEPNDDKEGCEGKGTDDHATKQTVGRAQTAVLVRKHRHHTRKHWEWREEPAPLRSQGTCCARDEQDDACGRDHAQG